MAINANKVPNKSKFKRPDPLDLGTYPARVAQVIGLGLQENSFKGEVKDPAYKLKISYEMLDEYMKDEETDEDLLDKPRWVHEDFYLFSLNSDKATSTKRYLSLDPEKKFEGDWGQLVGTPCMVTIVHNKSKKDPTVVYENVASVSAMRPKEALKARALINPPKVFDPDTPDMDVFFSLPTFIQDEIKANLEYEGSELERLVQAGPVGEKETVAKKEKAPKKPAPVVSEEEDEEDETW